MPYHCFVSYTTADNQQRAARLQTALQRLAKPWYRRRLVRVFRDESNLAAEASLTDALKTAIDESQCLIVLGSKNVQRSTWVGREVAFWLDKEKHQADPTQGIVIVVMEGELRWNEAKGDFYWSEETPLPANLRGQFKAEPKFIDFSHLPAEQWDLRNAKFADGVASITSRLLGRPRDEILSEDLKQHRRTRTVASMAMGAIVVLFLLSVVFAFRERAERRRAELESQRSQDLYRLGLRESLDMANFLTGPYFSRPADLPPEVPVDERRRLIRERLDQQISRIETDLNSQPRQLPLLLMLEGALNSRITYGGGVDDSQAFDSLFQKQKQLGVRLAREFLERSGRRYELELNAMDRSDLAMFRTSSVNLAKSPRPESPEQALHIAETYLGNSIKYVYYLDKTTEEGRSEARLTLQKLIALFEIAQRDAEFTQQHEDLLRDMRNELFALED
jgi:hypothetical protein